MTLIPRLLQMSKTHSAFLFGARNTGKSTLLAKYFSEEDVLWIDLLDPVTEQRFALNPNEFFNIVENLPADVTHVIVDEIQKIPQLLDVIQRLMQHSKKYFIMTGSNARKLKHGGANLLAGRAFVYNLYPFSVFELTSEFDLNELLQTGLLPQAITADSREEKKLFLQAYTLTYLKEEIWNEHLVRKLEPFRKFLEVAAQCNGKIINFARIAEDTGVDEKTVRTYFDILEETLIGFFLETYHTSFRKRLSKKPKFYFFDTGVVRALTRMLSVPLRESTSAYGEAFEHLVILECYKLCHYRQREYRLSYLKTTSDAEVDLVVERPGLPVLFIEIKSTSEIKESDLSSFIRLTKDFPEVEAICLSRDPYAKQYAHVKALPWYQGIKQYFLESS